jgi:hypothetical protein
LDSLRSSDSDYTSFHLRNLPSLESVDENSNESLQDIFESNHPCNLRGKIENFYKLPIFYLPTGDTTKSAEDREVKEEEEEEEEEE